MDNYNANGSGSSEDLFGFIPPNMMYPQNNSIPDGFSSKEELERYFYHLEHDNEFHLKNTTKNHAANNSSGNTQSDYE